MKTADFSYHLPRDCIAQKPAEPRDSSRLMIYNRNTGAVSHRRFYELDKLLRKDDLLVLNQTRVIRARLKASKIPTGGRAELLLLRPRPDGSWEALAGGKGLKPGARLQIPGGLEAVIQEDLGGALRLVDFSQPLDEVLDGIGRVPLPPYIQTQLDDPDQYQTVYARESGSAAAPTAGLHFTSALLDRIRARGIKITAVTLHIGLDTFLPVHEADPREHQIHSEWCSIGNDTVEKINQTRADGGRVVAVGTTSVRTLETAARAGHPGSLLEPFNGLTDLYILPGFQFQVVDCLITNFHLPESTLLMMISAFAGREKVLELYQMAMDQGYRFYSFGDAMLLE